MQQFKSAEQQTAFENVMRLKTLERKNWATVVVCTGEAYTRALINHLENFKFPREEAWDAYATKFGGGASLTKVSPTRAAWRRKQAANAAAKEHNSKATN